MSSAHPQPDPFALYSQQLHQYTLRLWCDHCRRVAKAQAREEADRVSRSSSPLKTPDDDSSESSSSSSSSSGSQSNAARLHSPAPTNDLRHAAHPTPLRAPVQHVPNVPGKSHPRRRRRPPP
ncbi:hypothetical protein EV121DRAFT_287314 [Schizophyllum commune]